MFRRELKFSLAGLLLSISMYSCGTITSQAPKIPNNEQPRYSTPIRALSLYTDISAAMDVMQRLMQIGWVQSLSYSLITTTAINAVLINNVQSMQTELSNDYFFDDWLISTVMAENEHPTDVVPIIDIMLTVTNKKAYDLLITGFQTDGTFNREVFKQMVFYATCRHDKMKRDRGCNLPAGQNPYEEVGTPQHPLPSRTAECDPSPSNCTTYFDNFNSTDGTGISAIIDSQSDLQLYIRRGAGTPSGETMFNQAWPFFKDKIRCIIGHWIASDDIGDNLASFNAGIQNFLSDDDSARGTFTGKMAVSKGYTVVNFEHKRDIPGEYYDVEVRFCKP